MTIRFNDTITIADPKTDRSASFPLAVDGAIVSTVACPRRRALQMSVVTSVIVGLPCYVIGLR